MIVADKLFFPPCTSAGSLRAIRARFQVYPRERKANNSKMFFSPHEIVYCRARRSEKSNKVLVVILSAKDSSAYLCCYYLPQVSLIGRHEHFSFVGIGCTHALIGRRSHFGLGSTCRARESPIRIAHGVLVNGVEQHQTTVWAMFVPRLGPTTHCTAVIIPADNN